MAEMRRRKFDRNAVGLAILLSLFFSLQIRPSEIEIRRSPKGNVTIVNRRPGLTTAPASPVSPSLAAGNPYQNLITAISASYGIDPAVVTAVCRAESAFNPRAVSRKGAVGLMQLMPETARQYGVTDRSDPLQNLTAGIRHLKYLYGKYQSLPLILAAYNAGEEQVRKYRGVPPFAETRGYIARVMRLLGLPYDSGRGRNRVFLYRQPNGRILLTDQPMSNKKGYRIIHR